MHLTSKSVIFSSKMAMFANYPKRAFLFRRYDTFTTCEFRAERYSIFENKALKNNFSTLKLEFAPKLVESLMLENPSKKTSEVVNF